METQGIADGQDLLRGNVDLGAVFIITDGVSFLHTREFY
jgi:hypothetical protein